MMGGRGNGFALFCAVLVAGCASSGSSSNDMIQYGGGTMSASGAPTGFTIDAPLIATEGAGAPASPTAAGTESFRAAAAGTVFPLTQTTLAFGASGIAADSATATRGATLTFLRRIGNADEFELNIPALGIRASFLAEGGLEGTAAVRGGVAGLQVDGFDHLRFGRWIRRDGDAGRVMTNGAFFIAGFRTPVDNLPTRGSAAYDGRASGIVLIPARGGYAHANVAGAASLTADFAARTLTGSLTGMIAKDPGGATTPWNDVGLSANIGTETSGFRGATAAASAPTGPFALEGDAAGHVAGGFFGPRANELGAVWTLNDGSGTAFGVIGATRP
jgi:hypothetical protein